MIISKDKVVSLTYELRLDSVDGEVIESLTQDSPLTFLYGGGGLLPKFEEKISGLGIGDEFKFELHSVDAYGEINMDAIVDVPIGAFEMDGKIDHTLLRIGNKIPMQDSAGNKLTGIVQEIKDERVRMDFNHPLAGSNSFFTGKVTEIREATEEEMHHGHVHAACNCGDGCSDCEDEKGGCC
jgi:FKBP-type peptidyl-prolyl cis-trans isomerase SlyD